MGVRASQRVDRDLARDAERLENAHCLRAAFDPDRVELAPDERVAGQHY